MELFANRYKIIELLGKGGMGNVYLAEDTLLSNEKVAVKVLKANLGENSEYKERFISEVKIARLIGHPNVIRTFDFGIEETQGSLYFTMEYLRGLTIQDRLKSGIPMAEVINILLCVCDGLKAIHDKNIIHRDLKPANIIQTINGEIKITDFGVSSSQEEKSSSNEVLGSAPYMSPESWGNETITPASDLYALGVLAYELLTGVLPFDGRSTEEFMFKHLDKKPTPPNEINLELSGNLNTLILRLLSKQPSMRPSLNEAIKVLEAPNDAVNIGGYHDDTKIIDLSHPMMKATPLGKLVDQTNNLTNDNLNKSKKPIVAGIVSFILITVFLAITSFFNFRNDKFSSMFAQLVIPLFCLILMSITPSLVAKKLAGASRINKIVLLIVPAICVLINAYERDLISNKILAPDNDLNGLITDSVVSLWHVIAIIPGGFVLSIKTGALAIASIIFSYSFIAHVKTKSNILIFVIIASVILLERIGWYALTKNQPFIITGTSVTNLIFCVLIGIFNLILINVLRTKIS